MNKFVLLLVLISAQVQALTDDEIRHFQPAIVADAPPAQILGNVQIEWYTTNRNLGDYLPQVTTFDGRGKLLASWTPHKQGVKNRPTFIFVHGGHGVGAIDVAAAQWARKELNANVLVLDSYWSRGKLENWLTWNEYGVNMRVLDAIAAGKFVLSQGVDPGSIYLQGGSQGGWTVLRTMTDDPFLNKYNRMFRAGIALYPNCVTGHWTSYKPPLGPYNRQVAVFTAGRDTATPIYQCDKDIFTQATIWKHYPDATHAFDAVFKGMLQDPPRNGHGECVNALNVYNRFAICRDNDVTDDVRNRVKDLVNTLTPYNNTTSRIAAVQGSEPGKAR
jgi:dienelactone hydrolase